MIVKRGAVKALIAQPKLKPARAIQQQQQVSLNNVATFVSLNGPFPASFSLFSYVQYS